MKRGCYSKPQIISIPWESDASVLVLIVFRREWIRVKKRRNEVGPHQRFCALLLDSQPEEINATWK